MKSITTILLLVIALSACQAGAGSSPQATIITGPLEIEGTCAYVESGGVRYALVWEAEMAAVVGHGEVQVVISSPDGEEIPFVFHEGEEVPWSGRIIAQPEPYFTADCPGTYWQVSGFAKVGK